MTTTHHQRTPPQPLQFSRNPKYLIQDHEFHVHTAEPSHLRGSGGSFILNTNDAHYQGLCRTFLFKYLLCETHIFLKSVDASDILHRATATTEFHNSRERFDPPKCHPNTRLAILTKIMKLDGGKILTHSLCGFMAPLEGAGKSEIAQTIAEMCEREMILLASFLFLKEHSLTQKRQLTYCHPRLSNYLEPPRRLRGHS